MLQETSSTAGGSEGSSSKSRGSSSNIDEDAIKWETVLDLDELAKEEKESWVWKGYSLLEPSNDRILLQLSRGGADAVVIREFDLNSKTILDKQA